MELFRIYLEIKVWCLGKFGVYVKIGVIDLGVIGVLWMVVEVIGVNEKG